MKRELETLNLFKHTKQGRAGIKSRLAELLFTTAIASGVATFATLAISSMLIHPPVPHIEPAPQLAYRMLHVRENTLVAPHQYLETRDTMRDEFIFPWHMASELANIDFDH
ncbi:MAG TPA: hypothetical protein VM577_12960 [Anaerovoracaceae bacterium]|nr:hypothetical protein [Anaerovoracaceae bacterium]